MSALLSTLMVAILPEIRKIPSVVSALPCAYGQCNSDTWSSTISLQIKLMQSFTIGGTSSFLSSAIRCQQPAPTHEDKKRPRISSCSCSNLIGCLVDKAALALLWLLFHLNPEVQYRWNWRSNHILWSFLVSVLPLVIRLTGGFKAEADRERLLRSDLFGLKISFLPTINNSRTRSLLARSSFSLSSYKTLISGKHVPLPRRWLAGGATQGSQTRGQSRIQSYYSHHRDHSHPTLHSQRTTLVQ